MKAYKRHPLAARFPEMSETDSGYKSLEASIVQMGRLVEPIVLLDDMILDGWHRQRICDKRKIEPEYRHFKKADGDPRAFVLAKASRRDCSDGQKAWSAAQFADDLGEQRRIGRPKKNERTDSLLHKKSSEIAGESFGISGRLVEKARELMRARPDLFDRLETDRRYNVGRAHREMGRDERRRKQQQLESKPVNMKDCRLIHGDAAEQLAKLDEKSAQVVFVDPPYNLRKKYDSDPTGDDRREADFLEFCCGWLAQCARILADKGSLFVMINGNYAARVEMILRELDLHRRNTIYWWETFPQNQQKNFSDAVRQIHYFTRSKSGFTFNDDVRVKTWRHLNDDSRKTGEDKLPDNVWRYPRIVGTSKKRIGFADAPPQLPIEIPRNCIMVASDPGDLVVDCFNGNGTSAIAALSTGRKYVGIDNSQKYLTQSERWIRSSLARISTERSKEKHGRV